MTTREIEEHLGEMYGVEVSPQFINRATEAVCAEVIEWQSRPLESVYPVVYIDGLRVSCSGKQEVLGLWVEETGRSQVLAQGLWRP